MAASAATTREDESRSEVFVTSASIRAVSDAASDDLLALIKKKAPDPSIFNSRAPFWWQAESSNTRLDAYYTRMDLKTLRNYAKDASDGVMFLDSHDKRQLGLGQSFRGTFEDGGKLDEREPDDGNASRVLIDFYTVPGLKLGRADSDSFIAGVQAGIIKDVSIGFIPGAFECNLCGQDPFDWWDMSCLHMPGAYYDSTGKNVVTKRSSGAVLAFAWVRDGRLSEVSAVYDGATPGAYVKKATFLAEAGEIDRAAARIVERQLRIRLPERAVTVPKLEFGAGGTVVLRGGRAIIDGVRYEDGQEVDGMVLKRAPKREQKQADGAADDAADDVLEILEHDEAEHDGADPSGANDDPPSPPSENSNLKREESPAGVAAASGGITSAPHADPEELRMNEDERRELERGREAVTALGRVRAALEVAGIADDVAPEDGIRALVDRIRDLEPRAKLGDAWRDRVISEAVEAGVRAEGKAFDEQAYRETFAAMRVDQIERIRDLWNRQAPDVGGRRTKDVGTEPPGTPSREDGLIPVAQFRSGR